MYLGESHRTWKDRQEDHEKAISSMNSNYATIRHSMENHPGEEPMYTFHYRASYMTSCERQIREAILIEEIECNQILNGKGEWG